MSKAFSLIRNHENILFLSKDDVSRVYLEEYVNNAKIFNTDTVHKNVISVIVLDTISNLENIDLSKINFTNKVTVFVKKINTIASGFITIKYFQGELGYVKTFSKNEYEKYRVIYFNRNKVKILYLSDIEDNRTLKIDNHLSKYCEKKKYLYKKFINNDMNSCIKRLKRVKKELIDTRYLVVLYKYSVILDWTFNIEKIVRINNLSQYSLSFDQNPDIMFHNFLVNNNNNTFNTIDEIQTSLRTNIIENYINTLNPNIYINKSIELFNLEKNYNHSNTVFGFIINLNKLHNTDSKMDLDIILSYYLNIHTEQYSLIFSNIYLKEYSWGIFYKGVIGSIKFRFKGQLDYLNGKGTYERITEQNYKLKFGEYNIHITFQDNFNKFVGYDVNTKAEIIGFLHI
jgi:hypothetical protein